jgi:hypothetical protein
MAEFPRVVLYCFTYIFKSGYMNIHVHLRRYTQSIDVYYTITAVVNTTIVCTCIQFPNNNCSLTYVSSEVLQLSERTGSEMAQLLLVGHTGPEKSVSSVISQQHTISCSFIVQTRLSKVCIFSNPADTESCLIGLICSETC